LRILVLTFAFQGPHPNIDGEGTKVAIEKQRQGSFLKSAQILILNIHVLSKNRNLTVYILLLMTDM
jgi:hypothetical protein